MRPQTNPNIGFVGVVWMSSDSNFMKMLALFSSAIRTTPTKPSQVSQFPSPTILGPERIRSSAGIGVRLDLLTLVLDKLQMNPLLFKKLPFE